MRYLASIGVVTETGEDVYVANNVTRNLAQRVTEAGICHWYVDIALLVYQRPVLSKQFRHNWTRVPGAAALHERNRLPEH